jgi:hypothetical protein
VFEFFKFDFLVDPKACEAMGEKVHKSGDPMIVDDGEGKWTGTAGAYFCGPKNKINKWTLPRIFYTKGGLRFEGYPLPSNNLSS